MVDGGEGETTGLTDPGIIKEACITMVPEDGTMVITGITGTTKTISTDTVPTTMAVGITTTFMTGILVTTKMITMTTTTTMVLDITTTTDTGPAMVTITMGTIDMVLTPILIDL